MKDEKFKLNRKTSFQWMCPICEECFNEETIEFRIRSFMCVDCTSILKDIIMEKKENK